MLFVNLTCAVMSLVALVFQRDTALRVIWAVSLVLNAYSVYSAL